MTHSAATSQADTMATPLIGDRLNLQSTGSTSKKKKKQKKRFKRPPTIRIIQHRAPCSVSGSTHLLYGAHSSSRHSGLPCERYARSLVKEQLAPSHHRPAIHIYIFASFMNPRHCFPFFFPSFSSLRTTQCQPHNHTSKQMKRTVFSISSTSFNQSFNGTQLLQSSRHLLRLFNTGLNIIIQI